MWLDEVYYNDPSYHLATAGKLTSSAWWHIRFGEFWFGYIHLHQFLMSLWMKVFGFDVTAVRALNYVFFFTACLIWLEIYRRITNSNGVYVAFVFVILMVCGHSIGYAYRSGRGDGLAILVYALFAFGYVLPTQSKYRNLLMIFSAALLPWSAIHVAVGLGSTIAVGFLLLRRQVLDVVMNFLIGMILGGGVLVIYLAINGVLVNYLLALLGGDINIIGTTMQYVLWDDKNAESMIVRRLAFITVLFWDRSVIVLSLFSIGCFLASYKTLPKEVARKILIIFGIGLVMGGMVFLIGLPRFSYVWISYVHFALASALLMVALGRANRPVLRNILGGGLICAAMVGLPVEIGIGFSQREQGNYDRVIQFIESNSETDDVAYADPPASYALMESGIATFYSTYARSRFTPDMTDEEKSSISVIFVEPAQVESAKLRLGGRWILQPHALRNDCEDFDFTLQVVGRKECGYNLVALRRANQ